MSDLECVGKELCCIATFLWLAWQDKKHLGITRMGLAVASMVFLLIGCFENVTWYSRVGGALFGVVILVFSVFSKEAIGIADGVIILSCGVAFGLYDTVTVCFFAAVFAGVVSVVLLLARKAGKKSRIPFFPFLCGGYVLLRVLQWSV